MKTGINGKIYIGGYLGIVWQILEKRMNFSTEFILPQSYIFGAIDGNGSWNGVVKMLIDNKIMFGVSEFTMTISRLGSIDFLLPLFTTSMKLYIQKPLTLSSDWPSFLAPFASSLWFGILATIMLVALTLTAVHRVGRQLGIGKNGDEESSLFQLSDSLLHVFALFCQQGNEMTPRYSCRAMCFLAGFTSIVILAAYSASLTSYLAAQKPEMPFDTLQGFYDDGSYKLEAVKASVGTDLLNMSSDPLFNKLLDRLLLNSDTLPENPEAGLDRLCQNKKNAFFAPHSVAHVYSNALPCDIIAVGTSFGIEILSFVTTKNNPYKGLANHMLHLLRDSGTLARLKRLSWPDKMASLEKKLPDVMFNQVAQIFAVVLAGVISGVVILACERIRHKHL